MSTPLNALRAVHLHLLLAAIVLCGFGTMDRLTNPYPESGAAEVDGAPPSPGSGRAFILIIDSLRYETAVDPAIMPNLVALRDEATFARMESTYDAVTVPALRAAFTGRDRVEVLGFVRNLWHRREAFPSIFTQLTAQGRKAVTFSDGSFAQFGDDLPDQRLNRIGGEGRYWWPGGEAGHNLAVEKGLELFGAGEHDLVIAHVTYGDYIAHKVGVHSPEYAHTFGVIDGLVGRAAASLGPDDTLVVMGDHGHDERGRHAIGLDTPTFLVFRGPGFGRALDLGTIPITDVRYLLSWALRVKLASEYEGGQHPGALVGAGEIPAAFANAAAPARSEGTGIPLVPFALFVGALALLAGLWTSLARESIKRERIPVLLTIGAWLAIALLVAAEWLPGESIWSAAVGATCLGIHVRRKRGDARALLWAILPVAGVVALQQWGVLLAIARPLVHYPRYVVLVPIELAAVGAAFLLSLWIGAMRAAWVLAVLGLGLSYPTVYRYGAPAAMGPVWCAMLAFVLIELTWLVWRARGRRSSALGAPVARSSPFGAVGTQHVVLRSALLAVAAMLLLSPFLLANGANFSFSSWIGPAADLLWHRRSGTPHVAGWVVIFLAKLVIFFRPRHGLLVAVTGFGIALMLQTWEMRASLHLEARDWMAVAPAIALGAAAIAVRCLLPDAPVRRDLLRVLSLGALFFFFHYSIRVPLLAYAWADCLFAALVLSAWFFRQHPFPERVASAPLFLAGMSVLVAGWITLAWSFHRLEWGLLYDLLGAELVERRAGVLTPIIALRYVIPVIVARILLSEAFGDRWNSRQPWPQLAVTLLAGARVLSLLMITIGIGWHQVRSDMYLEAVQETAIWMMLALPLVWPARRREARAPASSS